VLRTQFLNDYCMQIFIQRSGTLFFFIFVEFSSEEYISEIKCIFCVCIVLTIAGVYKFCYVEHVYGLLNLA